MIPMMLSLLCSMMVKYVHQIEVKKKESLDEKRYVEIMFSLYAF